MKPTCNNLWTSSTMALYFSCAKTLFFCHTGGKDGETLSWWAIVLRLIPSMPSCLLVKMFRLFLKKSISSLWTKGLAYAPIRVIRSGRLFSRGSSSKASIGSTVTHRSSMFNDSKWSSMSPTWLCSIREPPFGLHLLLLPCIPSGTFH